MKTLDVNQNYETSYCIPLSVRDIQIKLAIERVKDRIQPHDLRNEPAAIVGFGPSLNDTWKKLKQFKWIFSCSGSHKFLLDHGVIPSHHIEVDPRKHKVHLIGPPHKGVEYLIASTCHPDVLKHLEGFNVKLWHVFANDEDAARVLPRGEWAVTGGCDVGMRAMTIARFLGFQDLHIFGIDGSSGNSGRHAAVHPNQPGKEAETEYDGKKYMTTVALLQCAKQVFHELDQMPDVNATFYGEGLVQHMARNYTPANRGKQAVIAFIRPEVITEEYRNLNSELHRNNPLFGAGGAAHKDTVLKLAESIKTTSILDYGAGKQQLAKSLPMPIWSYDPAIPEISQPPRPAELVVCTDVLEHIEPDRLMFVLEDLQRCVKQLGYFVIHCGPSTKTLTDGRNAHLIQKDKAWWTKQLRKFFDFPDNAVIEKAPMLYVVVGLKKADVAPNSAPVIAKITNDGTTAKFLTPNKTTRWRAETLMTKEPATIKWIDSFNPGEVFYDVGANVGGYSVWAALRRQVKVYSFEPEASNYALLVDNLRLNQLDQNAYCVALSDSENISRLYLSGSEPGGSCNSFGAQVGFDLKPRESGSHGAIGFPLDELVKRGLPAPDHLKIDVDGLEFKVIKGAEHVLTNGLKSLLVEVNPSLPEHQEMLQYLDELGYEFDPAQVEQSTRKEGPFKGCAEYVFRRVTALEQHLIDAVYGGSFEDTSFPFPYLFIENVFPADVYAELIGHLPKKYAPISKVRGTRYPHRSVADPRAPVWMELKRILRAGRFKRALCEKFSDQSRTLDLNALTDETLLIRDKPGYSIGPHTDHPDKVISALFYLPKEETKDGTSLYVPRAEGFTCPGGPHHSFNKFKRVATMPFKPNSLFVFLKSDVSFHGVETTKNVRDVLLYDIRRPQ